MKRLLVLAVLGCSSSPTMMMTDSGPDGGADSPPPPQCNLVTAVELTGVPKPNGSIQAKVKETGARADFGVAWSVTSGAVMPADGKSTVWSFDKSFAMNGKDSATITATVSAEGCEDASVSADVSLDFTDVERTVVLYNTMVTGSKAVADHYAAFRGLPADHLCPMASASVNAVSEAEYATILDALLGCVSKIGARVMYVVPVFGVPYRVTNKIFDIANNGQKPPVSLDALLALGERSRTMSQAINNPAYQKGDSKGGAWDPYLPFGQLRQKYGKDYFLVARIDGADELAAKALVDRTKTAEEAAKMKALAGTVYVDGNRGLPHPVKDDFGSYEGGEWNIIGVETVFKNASWPKIVADYNGAEFGTAPAPLTCPDALYYAGWYSFNNYNDVFSWNVGAIGGHLDSCSACDFRGNTSWSARALRKGITATFGAVGEPYVAGMPEYDQFFLYLLQGASFGEAAYESTRVSGWMMVWLGDPLYRPYAK